MNEKIKELAEQSGAINDADYWGDEYFVLKGEENIEKFAELIIQDCLNITGQFEKSTIGASITEQIKEHFGVKE